MRRMLSLALIIIALAGGALAQGGSAATPTLKVGDGTKSFNGVNELRVPAGCVTFSGRTAIINCPGTGSSSQMSSQNGNLFFASPNGSYGLPSWRAILEADLPSINASKIGSGTIATARLGSGTASSSTYLRGDQTWATLVTSIAGTTNQVTASTSTGAVTLSLPQNIHTAATPTFSEATLTGSSTSGKLTLSRHAGDAAGEGMSIRNAPPGVADLGNILFYPATGTNVGTSFFISPKGTGGPFSIKAQFTIFGSDFVADSTNYEFLTLRADGTAFNLFSSKSGTGTARPLRLQTSTTGGVVANGGIFISTANLVGIGIDTPTAALDVQADTLRLRLAKTPASAVAACNAGDHAWDANYFYLCIATNTWRRTAHSTW